MKKFKDSDLFQEWVLVDRDYQKEYENEWVVDEQIERACELARKYHKNCDAFDGLFLSNNRIFESDNFSKCNKNALRERKIYMESCELIGVGPKEAQKILSKMAWH